MNALTFPREIVEILERYPLSFDRRFIAFQPIRNVRKSGWKLFKIPNNRPYSRYSSSLNNVTWYFRGQTKDKICQCEKSRSTLFILSKLKDDLTVMQNYGLSFDKINVIIICCEDINGRYCIKKVTMMTSTLYFRLSSLI